MESDVELAARVAVIVLLNLVYENRVAVAATVCVSVSASLTGASRQTTGQRSGVGRQLASDR